MVKGFVVIYMQITCLCFLNLCLCGDEGAELTFDFLSKEGTLSGDSLKFNTYFVFVKLINIGALFSDKRCFTKNSLQ